MWHRCKECQCYMLKPNKSIHCRKVKHRQSIDRLFEPPMSEYSIAQVLDLIYKYNEANIRRVKTQIPISQCNEDRCCSFYCFSFMHPQNNGKLLYSSMNEDEIDVRNWDVDTHPVMDDSYIDMNDRSEYETYMEYDYPFVKLIWDKSQNNLGIY